MRAKKRACSTAPSTSRSRSTSPPRSCSRSPARWPVCASVTTSSASSSSRSRPGSGARSCATALLLQQGPAAVLTDGRYLLGVLGGGLIGAFFGRHLHRVRLVIELVDALGLGVYGMVGAQKSLAAGLPLVSVALVGCVNAVGGGVLRDVLVREEPLIFKPGEFYALAALAGVLALHRARRRAAPAAGALRAGGDRSRVHGTHPLHPPGVAHRCLRARGPAVLLALLVLRCLVSTSARSVARSQGKRSTHLRTVRAPRAHPGLKPAVRIRSSHERLPDSSSSPSRPRCPSRLSRPAATTASAAPAATPSTPRRDEIIFAVGPNKVAQNPRRSRRTRARPRSASAATRSPRRAARATRRSPAHMSHPYGLASVNSKVAKVPAELLREGGRFECLGCHDPHPSNPNYKYLRVDTAKGSKMDAFCARLPPDQGGRAAVAEKAVALHVDGRDRQPRPRPKSAAKGRAPRRRGAAEAPPGEEEVARHASVRHRGPRRSPPGASSSQAAARLACRGSSGAARPRAARVGAEQEDRLVRAPRGPPRARRRTASASSSRVAPHTST